MTALVEVTTSTGRLRHLAREENLRQIERGRIGSALCDNVIFTDVYDQVAFDADRMRWNTAYKQKPIASLPICKRCAKKAGAA